MYPLVLRPPVKDYLWGGTRLRDEFGFESESDITAEAWMLSCHKDGSDTVINGECAGMLLPDVIEKWGKEALGKNSEKFSYFPVLIKLIDAKNSLSVQVHPDNDYALKNEGEFGKTEMWYVVDCNEGAELIYGFTDKITREEFKERIENNTLTDVCNKVPVKKGDVFFITAGTLHAIGPGILIAEVQQNSNSTYRVYDYGRLGADGKPRQLHIEKALDVTVCDKPSVPYGAVGEIKNYSYGTERELASCDLFTAKIIKLYGEKKVLNKDSFVSVIVLSGEADACWDGEHHTLSKGGSLFIPAGVPVTISGKAKLLYSFV